MLGFLQDRVRLIAYSRPAFIALQSGAILDTLQSGTAYRISRASFLSVLFQFPFSFLFFFFFSFLFERLIDTAPAGSLMSLA